MYFVDLPNPNSFEETVTLASFLIEQQAIAFSIANLGADEHGRINVISDDGEDWIIESREITIDGKERDYEVIINLESSYEISIVFSRQFDPENNFKLNTESEICFTAFYSIKDSRWNLVGHDKYAFDYEGIIDHCCEEIKTSNRKKS